MTTLLIYQAYEKKDYLFKLVTLTLVWLVLMENFSWLLLFSGLIANMFILHILKRAFPFVPIANIDWLRFITSHFFLIIEIYKQGLALIKLIFTDGQTSATDLHIQIHDKFMQSIFCMWITLVPGSIVTAIEKNHIELVVLHPAHQTVTENVKPVAIKLEALLKNCVIDEKKKNDNFSLYFFVVAKNAVILALFLFAVVKFF